MSQDSVARSDLDSASSYLLVSGSTNVYTNDQKTVFLGSVNSKGHNVIAPSTTVFVNDNGIGRESDGMNNGGLIESGSFNVFAGK